MLVADFTQNLKLTHLCLNGEGVITLEGYQSGLPKVGKGSDIAVGFSLESFFNVHPQLAIFC